MSSQTLSLNKHIRLSSQVVGHFERLILLDISEEGGASTSETSGPTTEIPYKAVTFLSRALSSASVISTSSFLARRYQAAQETTLKDGDSPQYRSIGSGQCGRVFGYAGDAWVLKRPNHEPEALWTEYGMHLRLIRAAENNPDVVISCAIIPEVKCFITPANKTWWDINMAKFPAEYRSLANLLVTQYIVPLPEPVRFSLIDQFCPKDMQEEQMKVRGNQDCLARVYLGKNSSGRPSRIFSLRNFNLFHDRMQNLELDLHVFASKMASSVALMHFGAHIDARDVEFVLGSKAEPTNSTCWEDYETLAPLTDTLPLTANVEPGPVNYCRTRVEMFVLDFNQCRSIEMTKEGMETAAEAFLVNDPYYPRPHHADEDIQKLWVYFCQVYRETATEVAGPELGRERSNELVDWFLGSIDARVRARHFGTG